MRLTFEGSANGQHTLQDLAEFLTACQHLGMPAGATLVSAGLTGVKSKLSGTGALRSIVADWDEHSTPATGTPAPPRTFAAPDRPTAAMPTTPMPAVVDPTPTTPVTTTP